MTTPARRQVDSSPLGLPLEVAEASTLHLIARMHVLGHITLASMLVTLDHASIPMGPTIAAVTLLALVPVAGFLRSMPEQQYPAQLH